MAEVLVTGASGYLGTWVVSELLKRGTVVRAVLRSPSSEQALREALARAGANAAALRVVFAELETDGGWTEAAQGVQEVYHLASPMIASENPDDLVIPAREGTLRVLRAARDAGSRRVVMTSSFAAIGYTPKEVREYDESDWTDPTTPGLATYPLSKAVAERAAWDFIGREGSGLELTVINPTWIAGPTLTSTARSSLQLFVGLLTGAIPAVPRQRFGIADVRDVAELHLTAMASPVAAGKRYLALADGPTMSYLDVALTLREHLGALAEKVTTQEAPGEEPAALVIHNERAKKELDFAPRPAVRTILDTATSLRDLGLLAAQ